MALPSKRQITANKRILRSSLLVVMLIFGSLGAYYLVHSQASTIVIGDINGDGKVDTTDLAIIASNYHKTGQTRSQGDLTGDGKVDVFDFAILASNWGETTTSTLIPPTPNAVSVAEFGANGLGTKDDTAAFSAAMTAALTSSVRYASGPGGAPQAVVYVPPGTYRIFHLLFLDNIRLEVDAGAVLEQAGNVTYSQRAGSGLIFWDGPSAGHPLHNVSLVGVGTASGGLKNQAGPVEPGWDISHSFTFNLDPLQTGGNNFMAAINILSVDGFLIENSFTIQNSSPTRLDSGSPPYPASAIAVYLYRARNDTPIGGPYYDPHNGTTRNIYDINSPLGYGPTQVTSGHNLNFSNLYSRGGTTLRMETDANLNKPFGSELKTVTANNIMGVNCNRAVSFSPHAQKNYDVHVSNVKARGCRDGVRESFDGDVEASLRGSFQNSTISNVSVEGTTGAQLLDPNNILLFVYGLSDQAFSRPSKDAWAVAYSNPSCSGSFQNKSNAISIDGILQIPVCQ